MSDFIGWSFVLLLAFNVAVNATQMIINTGKMVVFKLKLYYMRWLKESREKKA